jgi:hypothetical protein
MFRLARWVSLSPRTRRDRTRRHRSFQASIEAVEDRALLSTLSAISWTSGGVQHSAAFGIGSNDSVYMNEDATGWVSLGGYAKQVSAGLNISGNPVVYAIGSNNALFVHNASTSGTWVSMGGYVKQISASTDNYVFAIGENDHVFWNSGSGFHDMGLYALQISAGLDASGNEEVYAIGSNNAVYVSDALTAWRDLGGYAKQISGASNATVFAIGQYDRVSVNANAAGWVDLYGYAQQIGAGLSSTGAPTVYAIGANNALYVHSASASGTWVTLGGYVREIAPSITDMLPGDETPPPVPLVYAIGEFNGGFVYRSSFTSLGGYLQLPSGPGTLSSITWTSGGVHHSAAFGIGSNNCVFINEDTTGWVSLGGYAKQVSAGLNASGDPVVYAIGADNALYVNRLNGAGWVSMGGYVKQISASADNTVFVIGQNDDVYVNSGSGFVSLNLYAQQISAGVDVGKPEVFAIGSNNAVYVHLQGNTGWEDLGGYAKQVSAMQGNAVSIINKDDSVSYSIGAGWVSLGGYAQQISAGLDPAGHLEVFAIGADNALYVNHEDGTGWHDLGGYAREVAAPAFGVGMPGDVAYIIGQNQSGFLYQSGFHPLGGYLQG